MSFKGQEHLFFDWNKKTLEIVEKVIDNRIEDPFKKDKAFIKFYKQYLRSRVYRRILKSSNPEKIIETFIKQKVGQLSKKEYFKSIMHRVYVICKIVLLVLKEKVSFFKNPCQECDLILLPYHKNWVSDPELHYLLNNLTDTKVVLNNNDNLYKSISPDLVINDKDGYLNISDLKNISKYIFLVICYLFSKKEIIDVAVRYLYKKSYYLSLLNIVRPKIIGVIRGDMSHFSSLIRQVSNNKNIPVFSWSHSVYFYHEYYVAGVDYDYYFCSNILELDLYKDYWSKDCKYTFTGQTSYPSNKSSLQNTDELKYLAGFHGIFSTSVDSRVSPNTSQNFCEFVDAVVSVSRYIGGSFFYKSKFNYKRSRGEAIEHEAQHCEEYAINQFSLIEDKFEIINDGVSVKDIAKHVDIAFVYSMSTSTFELLQEHVKVIVFWPFKKIPHLFSKSLPLLVARDPSELIENSIQLNKMSKQEYYDYVKPYFEKLSFSKRNSRSILLQAFDNVLENLNSKDL